MTDTGKEEQADEERAIRNASSGQTIQLSQDITCKKNGGDRIKVEGKTITLDLNGHTLYRNRTKKDGDGHVIEVKSKSVLTITDARGAARSSNEEVEEEPSEVGSAFSGAGVAAIIAVAILALAAAGIAVTRRKKH